MVTRTRRKNQPKKQQRSLKRLWVHDSQQFCILYINNGVEGFDYFVTYLGDLRYRLTKLVPNEMKVYTVNINDDRRYCDCESFKQNSIQPGIYGLFPNCKHIEALLKLRSL